MQPSHKIKARQIINFYSFYIFVIAKSHVLQADW